MCWINWIVPFPRPVERGWMVDLLHNLLFWFISFHPIHISSSLTVFFQSYDFKGPFLSSQGHNRTWVITTRVVHTHDPWRETKDLWVANASPSRRIQPQTMGFSRRWPRKELAWVPRLKVCWSRWEIGKSE